MDSQKFDSLVKTLASGASRRHVLKGLTAGAVGLVGARALRGDASAQTTCPAGGEGCRSDANCTAGGACCIGTCARGNAGQGVGGNVCTYAERLCTRGRVCGVRRRVPLPQRAVTRSGAGAAPERRQGAALRGLASASPRFLCPLCEQGRYPAERGHSSTGRSPQEKPRAGDRLRDRGSSPPEASQSSLAIRGLGRLIFDGSVPFARAAR
jgi:hypothetical protein